MDINKKFFCILIAVMVCIALQFMCPINVYAQEKIGDENIEDSFLFIVPVGWTLGPIDEWTIGTTLSSNPATPVPAPQVPEKSNDSNVNDVVATANPLPLTVPVGWTPGPIDEWTIGTTLSSNPATPVPAPQVPEKSNDSNVNDVVATANPLPLTVPVGWTPEPVNEWTIDTTPSSNSATPTSEIDAKMKMPKVKKSKIKNGTITIKWKKVRGAFKYHVKLYNERTGKRILNKITKKVYFKSKVADAECSVLSVKVRAYSKSMKKWSKWSKMKVK